MQKMMKQAQKMQKEMAKVQESLGDITVEASAGGGVVKVVANCQQELMEVHIDPAAADPDDPTLLEAFLDCIKVILLYDQIITEGGCQKQDAFPLFYQFALS